MIILLMLFAVSSVAHAAGPSNIDGLTGRLEHARCESAFVMKLKAFEKFGETGKCQESDETEAMINCLKGELPKIADLKSDAVFELNAVENKRDFDTRIVAGGSQVFRSIRHGFHGETEKGPVLGFYRVGVESGDPYQIDFAPLNDDGTRTLAAFVPVKRALLPDLIYLFIDGCSLHWEAN